MQKILQRCFKLHAYKIRMVQALEPDDRPRRKGFTVDMLRRTDNDSSFPDVSTLRVSGMVNRRSCRICGSENPHVVPDYEQDSSSFECVVRPFSPRGDSTLPLPRAGS